MKSHKVISRNLTKSKSNKNMARNIMIGVFVISMMLFAVSTLNNTGQKNKHPIILENGQTLYAIETHSIASTEHYEDLIIPGYISIIDFTADWCPDCKRLNKFENKLVDSREDVIIRKLDVSQQEDFYLALKKYGLNFRGVPYSIVYGKDGELIANDSSTQRNGQRYIHSLINP